MTALFGTKARSGVRDAVTVLPEQLLSPPYELRTEMNWIDFSGTANPLGTPPSFLSSIQEAFSAGEAQLPARPRGPHPALGARAALRHARRVVSVRVHRRRHDTGGRPDLPALHRGRGHAWPGGVRARGGQRRPSGGRDTEPVGLRGARSPGRCAPRHLVRRGRAGQSRLPHQPPAAPADAPALPGDVRLGGGGRALHRAVTLGGESMVPLTRDHRNLVVVRSLCESFAMPGVPVSYCVAHPDTIAQIGQFYDSSGVSMLAEVIGELVADRAGAPGAHARVPGHRDPLAAVHAQPHSRHQHLSRRGELRHVLVRERRGHGPRRGERRRAGEPPAAGRLPHPQARRASPGLPTRSTSAWPCVRARTTRAAWPPCARSSARASGRALPTRRAGPVSTSAPFPCRARPRAAPERGRPSRLQRAAGRFPFMRCSRQRPCKERSSSTCTACLMSAAMPAASPPEATTGVS